MLHVIGIILLLVFLWFALRGVYHLATNKDNCAKQQELLVGHVLDNSFPWKYIGPRSK